MTKLTKTMLKKIQSWICWAILRHGQFKPISRHCQWRTTLRHCQWWPCECSAGTLDFPMFLARVWGCFLGGFCNCDIFVRFSWGFGRLCVRFAWGFCEVLVRFLGVLVSVCKTVWGFGEVFVRFCKVVVRFSWGLCEVYPSKIYQPNTTWNIN